MLHKWKVRETDYEIQKEMIIFYFFFNQEQENSNGFTFSKYFRDFFKLLRKFHICHVTVLKDENCGERTLQ